MENESHKDYTSVIVTIENDFFPKEEQQIVDACNAGMYDYDLFDMPDGESYFNSTYKND